MADKLVDHPGNLYHIKVSFSLFCNQVTIVHACAISEM